MPASITKRDGTEVPFDSVKILNAITKANQAVGGEDMTSAAGQNNAAPKAYKNNPVIIPAL